MAALIELNGRLRIYIRIADGIAQCEEFKGIEKLANSTLNFIKLTLEGPYSDEAAALELSRCLGGTLVNLT